MYKTLTLKNGTLCVKIKQSVDVNKIYENIWERAYGETYNSYY